MNACFAGFLCNATYNVQCNVILYCKLLLLLPKSGKSSLEIIDEFWVCVKIFFNQFCLRLVVFCEIILWGIIYSEFPKFVRSLRVTVILFRFKASCKVRIFGDMFVVIFETYQSKSVNCPNVLDWTVPSLAQFIFNKLAPSYTFSNGIGLMYVSYIM